MSRIVILCCFFTACVGQTNQEQQSTKEKIVGGGCDGCELMYIGMPGEIHAVDSSAGWNEKGQKLVVSGTVFQVDGKTPAKNVIIYYWQTDNEGYYSQKPGMDKRVKQHGHIRGWVKTNAAGKYTIQTIRPAPYPNEELPAHIHFSIKEPDVSNAYYIDDICFNDDKLLAPYLERSPPENRGGNAVVRIEIKEGLQFAHRDIILGLNIPGYRKNVY